MIIFFFISLILTDLLEYLRKLIQILRKKLSIREYFLNFNISLKTC